MGINRQNRKKDSKDSSCNLCKPHKRGWESFFKSKDKSKLEAMKKEMERL